MAQDGGLRAVLGLPALVLYGVGLILGSGIYSIIGAAAGTAGHGLWASFLTAALVAGLTGLSYAELSSMFPRAGAAYHYAREAFPRPRLLAPATGVVLAASAVGTAATVALAFGGYAGVFVDVPALAAAWTLLVVATLVNLVGVRQSVAATAAMTLVEAAGLVLVVALGLGRGDPGRLLEVHPGPMLAGAGLVFFAYLGFEDVANLAEEARRPQRDPARAILIALAVSTLLYVLVAVSAVLLLPPEELAASDSPLADAVERRGPRFAQVLGAIALFATANTALASLVAASRILFGIARGGDAPPLLGRVLPGRGTPWAAAVVACAAAALLVPLGGVAEVGSVASLAALFAFLVVNASLVALRLRRPKEPRPFRVPLAVRGVPVLAVLGGLGTLAMAARLPLRSFAIAAALGAAAVLALWAQARRGGRAAARRGG